MFTIVNLTLERVKNAIENQLDYCYIYRIQHKILS